MTFRRRWLAKPPRLRLFARFGKDMCSSVWKASWATQKPDGRSGLKNRQPEHLEKPENQVFSPECGGSALCACGSRCRGSALMVSSSPKESRKRQNSTKMILIELKVCTHLLQGVTKMSTKFELQKIKAWTLAHKTCSQTRVFCQILFEVMDLCALEKYAQTT